jgi:hypothetical protein
VLSIEDDLRAVAVTTTSPDGRIEGRMESLEHITVRFRHDSYEQYYRHHEAPVLAHQLSRGATLLAAAYLKARRAVMLAHGFERFTAARPPYSLKHREYLERAAQLTARGSSPDREIQVTTTGLVDFQVTIAADVPYRCDEPTFLRLANEAIGDMRRDYQRVHTALRHELNRKYQGRDY